MQPRGWRRSFLVHQDQPDFDVTFHTDRLCSVDVATVGAVLLHQQTQAGLTTGHVSVVERLPDTLCPLAGPVNFHRVSGRVEVDAGLVPQSPFITSALQPWVELNVLEHLRADLSFGAVVNWLHGVCGATQHQQHE